MIPYTEQIRLICYFVIFGLFVGATFDTLKYAIQNYVLLIRYVLEIIYWGIILIITYYYIINVQKGFINFYTVIFYVLGFISYYLILSQTHQERLEIMKNIYKKYLKDLIIEILIPIELFKVVIKKFKKFDLKKILKFFNKKT